MAYDGEILRRAREKYEADKRDRRNAYEAQRETLFRKQPRLREVDRQIRSAPGRVLAAALRKGGDPLSAVERLKRESLSLQKERKNILLQMGLPENFLGEFVMCRVCGDSGYCQDRLCPGCLGKYYTREQNAELSRMLNLTGQSFETFSLDFYSNQRYQNYTKSPRKNMEGIFNICVNYAREFGIKSENLLLSGSPGLGKTFLSAAIAREVVNKGFSVAYDTASRIFERFENRKFGREDTGADDTGNIMSCDLLILDDLGTEMITAFIQSALYEIINTRLLEKKSTIISTNLDAEQLQKRYSPQIFSRLLGEYQYLPFYGKDIRGLKDETQKNQWNRL